MKYFRQIILFLCACCIFSIYAQDNLPRLGMSSIENVIKAMTLEEKANLVVGTGMSMPTPSDGAPGLGYTKDKIPGAAGTTFEIPRLGITSLVVADGPAGVRIDSVRADIPNKTYYATAWPSGTLLASSWDIDLVQQVGIYFGQEAKEYGIDVMLAPALNIHRNPLAGRNFEYYSEDPLVTGKMSAAIINGIQSVGVGTSPKHFAVNNQETNRHRVDAVVSERALREIYLKGFEIAVKESNPWTIMSSFNLVNGTFASENNDLLTIILRDEWGFNGFVMTDWFGGKDPVEQMKAGNDLLMPGTKAQTKKIITAVENGQLDEAVLDRNIKRILNIITQSSSFQKYNYSDKPDLMTHAALARSAATESMVLLKNESVLPFSNKTKTALFGINSYHLITGGKGSGDLYKAYEVSLAEGFINAGYEIDKELKIKYDTYLEEYIEASRKKTLMQEFLNPSPPIPEMVIDKALIERKAKEQDIAIISLGRNAGEGRDRTVTEDYQLTNEESALIKNVADAFHQNDKKVLVVLNINGIIEVDKLEDYADAILLAWLPGLEGGNAMVDIISGKVNPSGKLATTFPLSYEDDPTSQNFPGGERYEQKNEESKSDRKFISTVTHEEGVYLGYRYYNTFDVKTAYEFGYGLSYTKFKYSKLKLGSKRYKDKMLVTLTVTNTGKIAGKEVVQLYITAPTTSVDKPVYELKGFAKTKLLKPGESEKVTFMIEVTELASYVTKRSAWVADAGTYIIKIGASSRDIRLEGTFSLNDEIVVEKTSKALAPLKNINELSN